jgi:hypothetical protein
MPPNAVGRCCDGWSPKGSSRCFAGCAIAQLMTRQWTADRLDEPYACVFPYTQAHRDRQRNIVRLAGLIDSERIAGDLVECGVLDGGTAALMAHATENRLPRADQAEPAAAHGVGSAARDARRRPPAGENGAAPGSNAQPVPCRKSGKICNRAIGVGKFDIFRAPKNPRLCNTRFASVTPPRLEDHALRSAALTLTGFPRADSPVPFTSPRTPSTHIPAPRASSAASCCHRSARRCARRKTGNDTPWRPAPWRCSRWPRPNRACCRA